MPINSKNILVVGGAGFIGSHMVLALLEAGYQPIVLDNLSKGHRHAVQSAPLIVADLADEKALEQLFQQYQFHAVMHFASFIEVKESVAEPLKYYENNVAATLSLLKVMSKHNVQHLIFSSTAALYGEPLYHPIDEKHRIAPINPYGHSKAMVETILQNLSQATNFHYASLRYFNAAGADPKARVGEMHEPESHLIPLILQVASGKRDAITVYGRDYATKDGTCIRDYVHVTDICRAHLLALEKISQDKTNFIGNLGTGNGYSVQEVIDAVKRVTQKNIPIIEGERRAGDPAILVADATRAKSELNWQPQYSDLDTIIQHAWQFLQHAK